MRTFSEDVHGTLPWHKITEKPANKSQVTLSIKENEYKRTTT